MLQGLFLSKPANLQLYGLGEYQTIYENIGMSKFDGIEYHGKGRAVSEAWIGESIGNLHCG